MPNTAAAYPDILEKFLKYIRSKVDKVVYNSFFSELRLASLEKDQAIFVANSRMAKQVLGSDYLSIIAEALRSVVETEYKIRVVTADELSSLKPGEAAKKPDIKSFFSHSSLLPQYTLDNFVVGDSNREAHQAATFVADKMGSINPLFIYSKSGLGKTHLLNAVGNAVRNKAPLKKILLITADDFVAEFVRYVKGDQDGENLKDFFRTVDYLLIDDIQFLANKPQTCTMFFHIFNLLYNSGKQIVLTSDRPPEELEGLEERLVSRFSSGISVSIGSPEKTTLLEILKYKVSANGLDVALFDEDALEYIAVNNSKNVRELEGALNRILFFNVNIHNCDRITREIAVKAFEGERKRNQSRGKITPDRIIGTVAGYYNLPTKEMTSNVRTGQIAMARHIAMYLCRTLLDLPFSQISRAFQKKDHTTVMSACTKVENLLKTDEGMKKAVQELKTSLKAA